MMNPASGFHHTLPSSGNIFQILLLLHFRKLLGIPLLPRLPRCHYKHLDDPHDRCRKKRNPQPKERAEHKHEKDRDHRMDPHRMPQNARSENLSIHYSLQHTHKNAIDQRRLPPRRQREEHPDRPRDVRPDLRDEFKEKHDHPDQRREGHPDHNSSNRHHDRHDRRHEDLPPDIAPRLLIHRHQEKADLRPALHRRPVLEPLDHPRPIHYQIGTDHEDHRHIDEEHEGASHQRQELTDDALYILDQLLLRGLHDRWRDADAV